MTAEVIRWTGGRKESPLYDEFVAAHPPLLRPTRLKAASSFSGRIYAQILVDCQIFILFPATMDVGRGVWRRPGTGRGRREPKE